MTRRPLVLAFTLSITGALDAQPLDLSMTGGAIGEPTTMTIDGEPGVPYLLLYAFAEQTSVVNAHVSLDIPLTFLPVAVTIPGFFGALDASGRAVAMFTLPPGDAPLADSTLSFQVIGGECADLTSNLVRLTPAAPGTFEETLSPPPLPIVGGAVVPLADGRVLLAGGSGLSLQTYDPDREEFAVGGVTFGAGLLSQATTLADGRVLFTGGLGADGQPTAAAAIYDPLSGAVTELSMTRARAGHGASLLPDGRVLITGGFESFDLTDLTGFVAGVQASTEVLFPASGFVAGPNMLEPRALHTSTRLTNGSVLVAGGLSVLPVVNIPLVSNTSYAFNPATGNFGLPQFFSGPRLFHSAHALPNGRAALIGGITLDLASVIKSGDLTQLEIGTLSDVQVYSAGLFTNYQTVTGLTPGRAGAGVIGLADGSLLIAGGFRLSLSAGEIGLDVLDSADRFLPAGAAGQLVPTGALTAPRVLPVMAPLPDGTFLIAGGTAATAEVYQP